MLSARCAWTGESRLSDVLKECPDALRRLAGISPRLAPLLEAEAKPLPGLVRLGELARMAELPLETVIAVLRGDAASALSPPTGERRAEEAFAEEATAIRLDVRPMLAAGKEPFSAIMAEAARVPEGGALLLDAPFDPVPLRRVLAGKGFASQGRRIAEGHWRVCFRRGVVPVAAASRRSGESWVEADGLHLDVRGLEPPQPMVQILALVDSGEADSIVVHHERDPIFLYPELEERGWRCRILAEVPGEVRLKLSRRR